MAWIQTNTMRKHLDVTMSNNKQNMKLYTEEKVLRMLEVCRDTDLYEHILTFEDILKTETPIELPSDEEIEKLSRYKPTENVPYNPLLNLVWIEGAKWMRDKIQGGNK